jgi:RNA polymerase sigma-70 factor (ECF subfamily)
VLLSVVTNDPGPAELAAAAEDQEHLWNLARDVLSEPQLSAIWLYYVEDFPVKEVARVLGCTSAWVKTNLHRARQKLLSVLSTDAESGQADQNTIVRLKANEH